jgi:hypothetical protein
MRLQHSKRHRLPLQTPFNRNLTDSVKRPADKLLISIPSILYSSSSSSSSAPPSPIVKKTIDQPEPKRTELVVTSAAIRSQLARRICTPFSSNKLTPSTSFATSSLRQVRRLCHLALPVALALLLSSSSISSSESSSSILLALALLLSSYPLPSRFLAPSFPLLSSFFLSVSVCLSRPLSLSFSVSGPFILMSDR